MLDIPKINSILLNLSSMMKEYDKMIDELKDNTDYD